MKRLLFGVSILFLLSITAAAQDYPKTEWSLGYSFVRFNSTSEIPAFTAQGGSTSVAFNINKSIGIVGEFGGYHNGKIGDLQLDNTTYTYLVGPRFSYRTESAIPFVHVLFGGAHATGSVQNVAPPPDRLDATRNSFAMAVGGGLDFKLSRRFALRPVQVDYLLTQLGGQNTGGGKQNNFRYTGGIVFYFGGK
jgi:opacity protein-like surface antigen